jgi:tetratricopeptide (TPR) repeat protein
LQGTEASKAFATQTSLDGTYTFSALRAGTYFVKAEKTGFHQAASKRIRLKPGELKQVDLTLEPLSKGEEAPPGSIRASTSQSGNMEFRDEPKFVVAGLTDWTSAGGHGSDTRLRTSEALTQETLSLKQNRPSPASTTSSSEPSLERQLREGQSREPESFQTNNQLGEFYLHSERSVEAIPFLRKAYQVDPSDFANAKDVAAAYVATGNYKLARDQVRAMLLTQDRAELHHWLGDIDERLGDALEAVREYERAARLDPSEEYFFDWGTELLLHRAIEPAIEVFARGNRLHPKSARILMGLGVSLYARGSYEDAVERLSQASDLDPADPHPYVFLGRMERVASNALPGVEKKLERFVRLHPDDASANYYYSLSLWKRERASGSAEVLHQEESLLKKAIELDPKFGEGYMQLGVLYSASDDLQEAIRAYQKAIEANPDLEEAHYRLALAYKRSGEDSKAQQEFQVYQQLDKEKAAETEQRRREILQFVYTTKGQPRAPQPQ